MWHVVGCHNNKYTFSSGTLSTCADHRVVGDDVPLEPVLQDASFFREVATCQEEQALCTARVQGTSCSTEL